MNFISNMVKLKIILFFSIATILVGVQTASAAEVVDSDKDGLVDELEQKLGTDPNNLDTDGDNYPDGIEINNGFNPLAGDRNRDVERRVEVDLSTQQMKYFFNNVQVGQAPVSTGKKGTETPVGEYKIFRKVPVVHYKGPGYDLPNTKWNLEFKKTYYLHGAYWHKQFGIRPMSHGCVNIGYADAEKIYKFLQVGDSVKVVGKTPTKALSKK